MIISLLMIFLATQIQTILANLCFSSLSRDMKVVEFIICNLHTKFRYLWSAKVLFPPTSVNVWLLDYWCMKQVTNKWCRKHWDVCLETFSLSLPFSHKLNCTKPHINNTVLSFMWQLIPTLFSLNNKTPLNRTSQPLFKLKKEKIFFSLVGFVRVL